MIIQPFHYNRLVRLREIRKLRQAVQHKQKKIACKKDISIEGILLILKNLATKVVKSEMYLRDDIYQDMCVKYLGYEDDEELRYILRKLKYHAIDKLRSKTYRYSSSNKSAKRLGVTHISGDIFINKRR